MGNIRNKDIDFLNSYWKELHNIIDRFKDLKLPQRDNTIKIGKYLQIINYKDLDNWDVGLQLTNDTPTFKIFRVKLEHMILTGKSDSIKPMLEKVCTNRIRKFRFKDSNGHYINCGTGHFRLGRDSFMFSDKELETIKLFFKYEEKVDKLLKTY
jgi:hypothetical protein